MSDVRAFVAGATGYTGRAVVEVLAEQQVHVVAHVRPDSAQAATWTERWQAIGAQVDTTAWDLEAMTATLQRLRPTHAFALLGTTRARAKQEGTAARQAYEAVDYGLTMMLRNAAEACGHAPRLVYLSAAGLQPDTRNPYMAVRARVEAALRDGTLPYTIARPSFITGEDRDESRPMERVGARVADGALAFAGMLGGRRLRERYRSTTNVALARGLVRVALDPAFVDAVAQGEQLR